MSGKTVRIDVKSYDLLLKERNHHPGMSLSDLADLAVQKTYGEGRLMASELTNETILEMLSNEHTSLLKAKDDQIKELKETLERERKLVDALTQLIERLDVSKDGQSNTK